MQSASKVQFMPIKLVIIRFIFVSDAKALIAGPRERLIKTGSELKLHCQFINTTQDPDTTFWYVHMKSL